MSNLYDRKQGLVSVVFSAYNYGHYICDALNSIKNQTYSNIEVIVVDDCSTDNTEYVVNDWYKSNPGVFKNFIYLKLPRNGGAGWALNIGFSISKGEYIVIHDADDLSHKEKIEKQVNLLRKHPNTAMVGTGYWTFKDDIAKARSGSIWLRYSPTSIEKSYKEKLNHCVSYGTIMFRAVILDEIIGCFKAIPVGNDMFFVNNIVKHDYVVENIKEKLFYVRQHKGQMNSKIRKNKLGDVLKRREKIKDRVSVVLTVKNSSKTILKALNSIAAQSYKNIEIIIIDDVSKDNTESIVKEWYFNYKYYDFNVIKELIYFKLPSEAEYPWTCNIGAYLSKGEYIVFHGDNGVSERKKIEKQVDFLKKNFMYSVVGTNIKNNGEYIKYDEDIEYSYTVDYKHCVNVNTIMLRYDVIYKTAGFNRKIQGAEDFEFIYRLLNNGYRVQNLKGELYTEY